MLQPIHCSLCICLKLSATRHKAFNHTWIPSAQLNAYPLRDLSFVVCLFVHAQTATLHAWWTVSPAKDACYLLVWSTSDWPAEVNVHDGVPFKLRGQRRSFDGFLRSLLVLYLTYEIWSWRDNWQAWVHGIWQIAKGDAQTSPPKRSKSAWQPCFR